MRLMMTSAAIGGAMAISFCASALAAPQPIFGDVTVVNPTIAPTLTALGIAPSPLGSAGVNANAYFEFPITGGALDGIAGVIAHEGSGVGLATATTSVLLENFIIDTVQQLILADVTLNGSLVASDIGVLSFDAATLADLADLFDLDNPALALILTDAAADLLETAFGLGVQLNGAQFGLAATAPQAVPLPAAAWLFIAGAAGLVAARRRRRAAPQPS